MELVKKTQKAYIVKNDLARLTVTDYSIGFVLALFALIIIFPFYSAMLQALVPASTFRRMGFTLIPPEVTLEYFRYVFKSAIIWNSMIISVIVTVVGTIYCMFLVTIAAYVWNFKYPGYKIFKFLVIFSMFFSGGLIPYYLLLTAMGLKNSIWVMILPYGIMQFYMIIIADSFKNMPQSLADAAKVDGANDFTIFARIMIPISIPILTTIGLYTAVDRWNEWYNAMLFISDTKKFPLQLVLRSIIQSASFLGANQRASEQISIQGQIPGDSVRMATIIITMIPILLLYPFLQKNFMKGITLGAIKE